MRKLPVIVGVMIGLASSGVALGQMSQEEAMERLRERQETREATGDTANAQSTIGLPQTPEGDLRQELMALRREVAALRQELAALRTQVAAANRNNNDRTDTDAAGTAGATLGPNPVRPGSNNGTTIDGPRSFETNDDDDDDDVSNVRRPNDTNNRSNTGNNTGGNNNNTGGNNSSRGGTSGSGPGGTGAGTGRPGVGAGSATGPDANTGR